MKMQRSDELSCLRWMTRSKMVFHLWQGAHHGQRHLPGAFSCSRLGVQRIQIRPQFVARNPRDTLDSQHTKRRDLIPLQDSLLGDVQRSGELGKAAGGFDGAVERCF
jgi:hypothetical protein